MSVPEDDGWVLQLAAERGFVYRLVTEDAGQVWRWCGARPSAPVRPLQLRESKTHPFAKWSVRARA